MKKLLIGNYLLLSFLVLSCGSPEEKLNDANEGDSSEVRLAQVKEQLVLGIDQKKNWKGHWAKILGTTFSENFDWVRTDTIVSQAMPEKNPIISGDPLEKFQFIHPEGRGTMDIYSSKIETRGSLNNSFFNPDGEVIYYKSDGMKERLLFMGPSGMFEDGLWLNSDVFIVLGYFQEIEGYRALAWMIDIERHLIYQFEQNQLLETYDQYSYLEFKLKIES